MRVLVCCTLSVIRSSKAMERGQPTRVSDLTLLGVLPHAVLCAVLRCSVDSVEEEVAAELKQLMDEVWVLGSLSHPSITRFCALCLDPPMIVMQVSRQLLCVLGPMHACVVVGVRLGWMPQAALSQY